MEKIRDTFLLFASRAYMAVSKKPRLTVVTLHRVGPGFDIQTSHVERCLRFLTDHFKVIRPSELGQKHVNKRMAIIMIDDGHVDAYRYIFPIAKSMDVPISLCISTDFFFRRQWLWFDKVKWAMRHAKPDAIAKINGIDVSTNVLSSFDRLRASLKRLTPAKRDLLIDELMDTLKLDIPSSPPEEYRAVTDVELREMLSSGLVEIVGHTMTHTIATVLRDRDLKAELMQSKEEWEAFLDRTLLSFCYPNGLQGDFNGHIKLVLQKIGYANAFISVEGTNLVREIDPFEIRRIHVHPNSATLYKTVSGLGDLQKLLGL